ncbi:MAG: hypothetical protein IJ853_01560 [Rickettsiales bacterium]|nr:hypothetical protein [Rickettsiales bacterium]
MFLFILKKIFIIIFLLAIGFLMSFLTTIDGDVVIYAGSYEVFTNAKFIIFLSFTIAVILFLFTSIYYIFTNTSKNKIAKKINAEKNKYDLYLENIYNAITSNVVGDVNGAKKYFLRADKFVKNKLTDLIKTQIFMKESVFNEVNFSDTKDIVKYNIFLSKAIADNDVKSMKLYANEILNINKNDKKSLEVLYKISKDADNWDECLILIDKIKRYLSKQDFKNEMLIICENLAKNYYTKDDYNNSLNYSLKVFNADKTKLSNNKIIINSMLNLKDKRLLKYVKKIWKYTPDDGMGQIYLGDRENKVKLAKKLYNINKKDIKSIVFYCNVLIATGDIDLIDERIIDELNKYQYKETFKIIEKLEEKEKANSFLVNTLREKISSSKSMYDDN